MDQNSTRLTYLKNQFPTTSDAKIKEVLFVGPQIRKLKQEVKFEGQPNEVEKAKWKLIKNITMENHEAKTLVMWWQIQYNPTNVWGVMYLYMCPSETAIQTSSHKIQGH